MSELNEKRVIDFLINNPDFISRRPELLKSLELLPTQPGVTNLVHRQQSLLREKNKSLQDQLNELIATAARNEKIFEVYSCCHRLLLSATNFNEFNSELGQLICNQFDLADCAIFPYEKSLEPLIKHKLASSGIFLGRLADNEQTLLFDTAHQSYALYLVGSIQQPLAILAFASAKETHYQPTQSSTIVLEFVKALEIAFHRLTHEQPS